MLLTSVAPAAVAQSECDFSISNYARAVQLHDMGDYGRALQHYDCALLEDPDDPVIPILIDNVYEDIASAGQRLERAPAGRSVIPLAITSSWARRHLSAAIAASAQAHLHCVLLADRRGYGGLDA